MKEKPNRMKLRLIMTEHDLIAEDVAVMLGRTLSTVQTWMSKAGADMPNHLLELLEYKLADR